MGEAKLKLEAIRKRHIELSKHWDFPPTAEEAVVCAGLRELSIVTVRRASPEELAFMRMPANSCHQNAWWYERNDPTGRSRAVTGWWVQWPDFVLHSVLQIDGNYICITPQYFDDGDFPFMPDPAIAWEKREDKYIAKKEEYEIGIGVRLFPEFTMARLEIVRKRLMAGVNPFKAIVFSDKEMDELKVKYVDADLARVWNSKYR